MRANNMELDWDVITDQDFEELCYDILDNEGFVNITWMGRSGGDRGRDITGLKSEVPLTGIQRDVSYLIQCKKYLSRPPVASDLNSTIAWANVHRPNVLIIMVSNILSSNTNDWINLMKKTVNYDIIVYDLKKLEKFLESNPNTYIKFFETEKGYHYNLIKDLKIEIINKLTTSKRMTAQTLSDEIGSEITHVNTSIKELSDEKFINSYDGEEIYLLEEIDSFTKVSNYMLNSSYRYVFLLSSYAHNMIDIDLVNYISERYYITSTDSENKQLHVLISTSPSCLHEALFSNTEIYKKSALDVKKLKLQDEEAENWMKMAINQFFMKFMQLLLLDQNNPEGNNIMKEKGIRGFDIKLEINMANIDKLIFGVNSHTVLMYYKASGPIEAGQIVSATNPDLFIESSMILMHLGLTDKALKEIDIALGRLVNPEQIKIAWNNKGVILMRLGRLTEAITCFDNALSIDPTMEAPKKNKKICVDKEESNSSIFLTK